MPFPDKSPFRRVCAPLYCRPAGLLAPLRYAQKNNMPGIRVLTDVKHGLGQHVDLELLLPTREFLSLTAQVVWISLTREPAKWEVGLRVVDLSPKELALLQLILENEEAPLNEEAALPDRRVAGLSF